MLTQLEADTLGETTPSPR